MTFRVSLLFQADARAARAEVDGLAASARKVGDASQDMGRQAQAGARGVDSIAAAADGAEGQLQGMAAAQRTAAASSLELTRGNQMAAGATGNLVAQFNDIGMMLAAGQNPLQLAIQQGTQITQVIGPMGAAGAARALGAAFLGMLAPINLITIGAIAAGATIVQWLMSAGEEAATLEERIDTVRDALGRLRDAQRDATAPFADLAEVYGDQVARAREFLQIQRSIAEAQTQLALQAATDSFASQFGKFSDTSPEGLVPQFENINALLAEREVLSARLAAASFAEGVALQRQLESVSEQLNISRDYELSLQNLIAQFALTRAEAEALAIAISAVGTAEGPEAQAQAAQELARQIYDATDGLREADTETLSLYQSLLDVVLSGMEFAGLDLASGIAAGANEAARLAANLRAAAAAIAGIANANFSEAVNIAGNRARLSALEAGESAADGVIAGRLAEERTRLSDAFGSEDAAIRAVAQQELSTLETQLRENAVLESQIAEIEAGLRNTGGGNTGSSPGGGGTRAERDAVGELIAKLQEELDILRETDPVQQELLRHRETLANATDAERAEVEALIAARESERAAAEAMAEMWDFLGRTGTSALMGIATGAESLEDAARNAAAALAEAVLQGALLGQGPFGGIFGGTSVFGAIGSALGLPTKAEGGMIHGPGDGTSDDVLMWGSAGEFVVTADATARYRPMLEAMNVGAPVPGSAQVGSMGSALGLPAKAEGGMIYGPGDGTSDDVLMWGSAGEFVVTADATARYRAVLEAMNAGAPLPRYARGGLIGSAPTTAHATGGGDPRRVHVSMDLSGARGDREIEEASYRGMQRALEEYDRSVLPVSMRRVDSDPWRTG